MTTTLTGTSVLWGPLPLTTHPAGHVTATAVTVTVDGTAIVALPASPDGIAWTLHLWAVNATGQVTATAAMPCPAKALAALAPHAHGALLIVADDDTFTAHTVTSNLTVSAGNSTPNPVGIRPSLTGNPTQAGQYAAFPLSQGVAVYDDTTLARYVTLDGGATITATYPNADGTLDLAVSNGVNTLMQVIRLDPATGDTGTTLAWSPERDAYWYPVGVRVGEDWSWVGQWRPSDGVTNLTPGGGEEFWAFPTSPDWTSGAGDPTAAPTLGGALVTVPWEHNLGPSPTGGHVTLFSLPGLVPLQLPLANPVTATAAATGARAERVPIATGPGMWAAVELIQTGEFGAWEIYLQVWVGPLSTPGILAIDTLTHPWWLVGTRDPSMHYELLCGTALGWVREIVAGEESLATHELMVSDGMEWHEAALFRPET